MSLASYSLLMLLVAVTNTVLGFGLAMLIGHGPGCPRVSLSWRRWLSLAARLRPNWQWPLRRRAATASAAVVPVDDESPALKLTPIQFGDPLPAPAAPATAGEALSLDAALAQLQREVAAARESASTSCHQVGQALDGATSAEREVLSG